jgi:hypothetical protein
MAHVRIKRVKAKHRLESPSQAIADECRQLS